VEYAALLPSHCLVERSLVSASASKTPYSHVYCSGDGTAIPGLKDDLGKKLYLMECYNCTLLSGADRCKGMFIFTAVLIFCCYSAYACQQCFSK